VTLSSRGSGSADKGLHESTLRVKVTASVKRIHCNASTTREWKDASRRASLVLNMGSETLAQNSPLINLPPLSEEQQPLSCVLHVVHARVRAIRGSFHLHQDSSNRRPPRQASRQAGLESFGSWWLDESGMRRIVRQLRRQPMASAHMPHGATLLCLRRAG
jgi:hypothetical protein